MKSLHEMYGYVGAMFPSQSIFAPHNSNQHASLHPGEGHLGPFVTKKREHRSFGHRAYLHVRSERSYHPSSSSSSSSLSSSSSSSLFPDPSGLRGKTNAEVLTKPYPIASETTRRKNQQSTNSVNFVLVGTGSIRLNSEGRRNCLPSTAHLSARGCSCLEQPFVPLTSMFRHE